MGLTQSGLAQRLGISRRAVSTWELGSNYPATAHLKELIVLGMRASAFPAGHEEEEIRAFWRAAHQKVLLDERWLQGLLGTQHPRLVLVAPQSDEQTNADEQAVAQPALGPRIDRGDALDVAGALPGSKRRRPGRHWQIGAGDQRHAAVSRPLPGRDLSLAARCP